MWYGRNISWEGKGHNVSFGLNGPKVPESHNIVSGNTILILLRHRIETCVPISNEGYDMEKTLLVNLVKRLAVPLVKGVVPTDGS
jgi:hypothetical protein